VKLFPKTSRYTLGTKIDGLIIEAASLLFTASWKKEVFKLPYLQKAAIKIDELKFFFRFAWEINVFDNKRYALLSEFLDEIGRMLGGWQRQIEKKNSSGASPEEK